IASKNFMPFIIPQCAKKLFQKIIHTPIGLERLILLLQAQNISLESPVLSIYLVAFGEPAQRKSMQITQKLRRALPTAILYNDVSLGSFKTQFKKADKAGADFALILGEEEISNNQISLKPLKNQGSQQTMSLEKAINYLENL
ncbi:MAG: hypothetical protein HAW59_00345, partial [Betaproteobacteria bacterium]|nr:hypothetical protein [Betaproteobacteria bacterium]